MPTEHPPTSSDMVFAEFLDWCCGRYAKRPEYRRTLRRELPDRPHPIHSKTRRSA